jgi:hypothetical protein
MTDHAGGSGCSDARNTEVSEKPVRRPIYTAGLGQIGLCSFHPILRQFRCLAAGSAPASDRTKSESLLLRTGRRLVQCRAPVLQRSLDDRSATGCLDVPRGQPTAHDCGAPPGG